MHSTQCRDGAALLPLWYPCHVEMMPLWSSWRTFPLPFFWTFTLSRRLFVNGAERSGCGRMGHLSPWPSEVTCTDKSHLRWEKMVGVGNQVVPHTTSCAAAPHRLRRNCTSSTNQPFTRHCHPHSTIAPHRKVVSCGKYLEAGVPSITRIWDAEYFLAHIACRSLFCVETEV